MFILIAAQYTFYFCLKYIIVIIYLALVRLPYFRARIKPNQNQNKIHMIWWMDVVVVDGCSSGGNAEPFLELLCLLPSSFSCDHFSCTYIGYILICMWKSNHYSCLIVSYTVSTALLLKLSIKETVKRPVNFKIALTLASQVGIRKQEIQYLLKHRKNLDQNDTLGSKNINMMIVHWKLKNSRRKICYFFQLYSGEIFPYLLLCE